MEIISLYIKCVMCVCVLQSEKEKCEEDRKYKKEDREAEVGSLRCNSALCSVVYLIAF